MRVAPKYFISVFIFFNVLKVVSPAVQCQEYLKYDRRRRLTMKIHSLCLLITFFY